MARKPTFIAVGSFHFQPHFEIEEIERVEILKPGEDPNEVGERLMAEGDHYSYCTFLPKSRDYAEVSGFFMRQQALNARANAN